MSKELLKKMWDVETSRSIICSLLENKKQNTFASKNNLESNPREFHESTKSKSLKSTKK